jgi:hypothetical protein
MVRYRRSGRDLLKDRKEGRNNQMELLCGDTRTFFVRIETRSLYETYYEKFV